MKKFIISILILAFTVSLVGCEESSDTIQREQQERILAEGTAQVGMPAIVNFRERKLLKDIIELRDQEGLTTYTYLVSEMNGQVGDLLCKSIGYGIPAATQFTNPMKYVVNGAVLPQADPNGLFSPSSAEGTLVMCLDKKGGRALPIYVEPRVIVSPFELK